MELTGKLKDDVAKSETREEAQDKIKDAGIVLNDEELDSVAGGLALLRRPPKTPESEGRRRKF